MQNGGLVVRLPNGEIARAPYMLPYVSLKSRAKINISKEKELIIVLKDKSEIKMKIGEEK